MAGSKSDRGQPPSASINEFRSLLPYFKRYRLNYTLGFFFLLAVDAAQVVLPQFIRQAVDVISSGSFKFNQVLIPSLIMVGLMGIVSLGRFFWRFFIQGSARRIEAELREKLFTHLLSLSFDFYQKNKIGDLMARATNDLNAVRESIGWGLVALVDGTVMATAIIVIVFIQDARTALWAILPLPIITIMIMLFGKAIGKRFRRAHETFSALSDAVQETFAGIRVIKSFVKEWWFIKKFASANDDYKDANMGLVQLFGIFFPFIGFLSELTVLIVLLVGGIRVIEGLMSPGELVALFRYLQMLIWPLMGAGFVVNMLQRGAVSLGRVNEVMRAKPLISSPLKPEIPDSASESERPLIEIKNLSFGFSDGIKVLDNVNLSIKKGTVTGILGRTGSGKTTLIKAITRMIEPPSETVFIKGNESKKWNLSDLRKLFGVTPQDSYLFSDSIKNNIGYALESEDEKIISRAVSIAALENDLSVFKEGWNTPIGERGLTLSGGQKQRTAMARSLAAGLGGEREIFIFDDSLSSVDAETEKCILDGLLELVSEKDSFGHSRTVIIISHRVSALSRCDEVVVLEKGRIIEQGNPRELESMGGFYAHTAALQSLGG
jgi:ATP-binding cassette subfamily B protein